MIRGLQEADTVFPLEAIVQDLPVQCGDDRTQL